MTPPVQHYVDIWREGKWPFQWIGMCSCGQGIRCNSGRDAERFFERTGCALAPQNGTRPRHSGQHIAPPEVAENGRTATTRSREHVEGSSP